MALNNLIEGITWRIKQGLPGEEAQYKMAPASRPKSDFYLKNKIMPKMGGVLILLYELNDEIHLALTLRKEYNGVHSKQVSFPGGKYEDQDKNLLNTALREAQEEVGIKINEIKIITKLTDLYIPPSNFLVSPYLGFSLERPIFKIDEIEVEQLIEVPINKLLDKRSQVKKEIDLQDGSKMNVPCYLIEDKIIWGATAMIISEFLELCDGFLIE